METNEALIQASQVATAAAMLTQQTIKDTLQAISKAIIEHTPAIMEANQSDLARMDSSNPKYDRLLLTPARIEAIANDMQAVAALATPVGQILSETDRPNGMQIVKMAVPLGVVGVIYEARPNVTLDIFSLCLRTNNVCVLKGGSDADATNQAIVCIIHQELERLNLPKALCTLLHADREATAELLQAVGLVDVIIPRGSNALIQYVRSHALVPVIETGAGVCHAYIDVEADTQKAQSIVTNAKTRRVSVCNALDCVLIHKQRLADLPTICELLATHNVQIYADSAAYDVLKATYPAELLFHADTESFGTEFLDYKMSIRTVSDLTQALQHIAQHSSKHSESILTENATTANQFELQVDASCVYTNVSTAFTDGGQFGFGAEVGISTQKLHARGPMGLDALTTYKYLIRGNGQTRN
jgi:glutamate-5-semialdehyde dehydrogenase